ncbi:MAG: hypothetical protein Q4A16_06815 [Lautropia sp.]|nr:hypothetical protein [Lautropia sp.]
MPVVLVIVLMLAAVATREVMVMPVAMLVGAAFFCMAMFMAVLGMRAMRMTLLVSVLMAMCMRMVVWVIMSMSVAAFTVMALYRQRLVMEGVGRFQALFVQHGQRPIHKAADPSGFFDARGSDAFSEQCQSLVEVTVADAIEEQTGAGSHACHP